jgi:hypothetical protein
MGSGSENRLISIAFPFPPFESGCSVGELILLDQFSCGEALTLYAA